MPAVQVDSTLVVDADTDAFMAETTAFVPGVVDFWAAGVQALPDDLAGARGPGQASCGAPQGRQGRRRCESEVLVLDSVCSAGRSTPGLRLPGCRDGPVAVGDRVDEVAQLGGEQPEGQRALDDHIGEVALGAVVPCTNAVQSSSSAGGGMSGRPSSQIEASSSSSSSSSQYRRSASSWLPCSSSRYGLKPTA
jgi:hypothetical protein